MIFQIEHAKEQFKKISAKYKIRPKNPEFFLVDVLLKILGVENEITKASIKVNDKKEVRFKIQGLNTQAAQKFADLLANTCGSVTRQEGMTIDKGNTKSYYYFTVDRIKEKFWERLNKGLKELAKVDQTFFSRYRLEKLSRDYSEFARQLKNIPKYCQKLATDEGLNEKLKGKIQALNKLLLKSVLSIEEDPDATNFKFSNFQILWKEYLNLTKHEKQLANNSWMIKLLELLNDYAEHFAPEVKEQKHSQKEDQNASLKRHGLWGKNEKEEPLQVIIKTGEECNEEVSDEENAHGSYSPSALGYR